MAKGYLAVPSFIRAALLRLPRVRYLLWHRRGHDLDSLGSRRLLRVGLTVIAVCIGSASLLYDIAYLKGLSRDPRVRLHDLLRAEVKPSGAIRVCLDAGAWNYFVVDPAFTGLPPSLAEVRTVGDALVDPDACDVAVLWAMEYDNHAHTENRIRRAEASGRWSAGVDLRVAMSFAGISFAYERNPHDLVYDPIPPFTWSARRASQKTEQSTGVNSREDPMRPAKLPR